MSTNNQILISEIIKRDSSENPQYKNEDSFFEFFAAQQVLKKYDLSDEEIEQHPHKVNEQQAQPIDHHEPIAPVRDKIAEHQARDDGIENAHERHGERRRHVHGEKPFVRAIIGKKPFEHVITYITFII